jgi:lipid kinase YegS
MPSEKKRTMRLVLNGKAAADPALRPAVAQIRDQGYPLEVRVTWEFGDAARYAAEAMADGIDVVIAGGGDGTVNEVVNGIISTNPSPEIGVAVIPYGTANDFATSCGIPVGDPLAALQLAAEGTATPIDVGKVNDRFFVNIASGGFGAEVTANTPPQMKKALGGVAYSLMGVVTAAKMNPYQCRFTLPDGTVHEGGMIVMAVGNGRQCGGGFQVTPRAFLNDGLLDVMVVHDTEIQQFGTLLTELSKLGEEGGEYVAYTQVPTLQIESDEPIQLNLDGEPYRDNRFDFSVVAAKLSFVLPADIPLIA